MTDLPTWGQIRNWDASGLETVAAAAGKLADEIADSQGNLANTVSDTIVNLDWSGDAKTEADNRADRERTQLQAVATAYTDLQTATIGAFCDLTGDITAIKNAVTSAGFGFTLADGDATWTIAGKPNGNITADELHSDLIRLAEQFSDHCGKWGPMIAAANAELLRVTPAGGYTPSGTELTDYQPAPPQPPGGWSRDPAMDLAQHIAYGHSWDKHVVKGGEFPDVSTPDDLAKIVYRIMTEGNPINGKTANGSSLMWDDGILVIVDPTSYDEGTVYRPQQGFNEFLRLANGGTADEVGTGGQEVPHVIAAGDTNPYDMELQLQDSTDGSDVSGEAGAEPLQTGTQLGAGRGAIFDEHEGPEK